MPRANRHSVLVTSGASPTGCQSADSLSMTSGMTDYDGASSQRSVNLQVISLRIKKVNRTARLADVFLIHNFDAGFFEVVDRGGEILFGKL